MQDLAKAKPSRVVPRASARPLLSRTFCELSHPIGPKTIGGGAVTSPHTTFSVRGRGNIVQLFEAGLFCGLLRNGDGKVTSHFLGSFLWVLAVGADELVVEAPR